MFNFRSQLNSFAGLLKSADFAKAIVLAIAIIVPVIISVQYGNLSVGIAMAMGVLLSAPSDIPGGFRRRLIGVLASIAIAVFATLVTGYAASTMWIFVPLLLILTFGFSMLSVYGFRASLISFSGLFAVVLGMANVTSENSILFHTFLIACGGLGYLLLSVVLHYFSQKRRTEELLAEACILTSDYLHIRAELLTASEKERDELKKELSTLQSKINETHETIRELVISRRINSGKSGGERKKLFLFIELVDILELGMANPVNYKKMDALFGKQQKEIEDLRDWGMQMASILDQIGQCLKAGKKYKANPALKNGYNNALNAGSNNSPEKESVFLNLVHFKEKQARKITSIQRIFENIEGFKNIPIKTKEAEKFITHEEYSLKKFQSNIDLKSPVFRHALRLSLVILLGLGIGKVFEVQNAYWILLTSLVIMRPGYALTKTRFKQRLIGTLIGGGIATLIILITQNLFIHGILAIVTFVLALSMIQRNYKTAAAFITLNVVFVYSLLTPNAFEVIQFRLLDTLIGAGLAFLGNSFLWPTWEVKTINYFIAASIKANRDYLKEIELFYRKKGDLPTSYKLARKNAFLESGNLSAAFQRITQEPKLDVDVESIYNIVTLDQEILSSIASLGTFIRTQETTAASPHFMSYMDLIQISLNNAVLVLEGKSGTRAINVEKMENARYYFKTKTKELTNAMKNEEIAIGEATSKIGQQLQEAQLIFEQLQWLQEVSSDMEDMVLDYKKNPNKIE